MARNRIRGITVEIGGDTTKLDKALAGTNKQLSATQQALRDVERLLKLDPGNTELLAQKQRLLAQAAETTAKKLDTLKEAAQSANQELKEGKLDQGQYDALQRELEETERQIKDTQKAFKDCSSGLDEFERKAGNVSKKAKDVSKELAPVTKAIGALGAAAIATVPATEEFRADLSMLDNNARQAGVGIDAARQAFQNFNTVSGETDSSIEAVSNLLQAGFTESNLQRAVEGLANAAITFPDTLKIESLADSLQETLATGSATGQFAELLDRVGYGAENFSQNLAFCNTELDKQKLALSVLVDGPLKGAYDGWQKNNQGLVENREASLELQTAIAQLADSIQPLITDLMEFATEFLDWFNSLDDGTKRAIIGVLGVTAAISPLSGLVADVSRVLPNMVDLFSKLGAKGLIVTLALGTLIGLAVQVANVWDNMSGLEKVVVLLAAVGAAALTAAVAVGSFSTAATLGAAAIGIVAGITSIMFAIDSATRRANQATQDLKRATASGMDIPGFANGGVVPPNQPFLAVLGDNKREPEVVSPYSTIKQAASDALAERGGSGGYGRGDVYLDSTKVGRVLYSSLESERTRLGVQLIGGRR